MASTDSIQYYRSVDSDTLRAMARIRCLPVTGIEHEEIVGMLMEQDRQTASSPWVNDEDAPNNDVDTEGWQVAGAKNKKVKRKTSAEKKMLQAAADPDTQAKNILSKSRYAVLEPVVSETDTATTSVKGDASSVAATGTSVMLDTFAPAEPESEAGSSTKAPKNTAPLKGKGGNAPIPWAQLRAEWDAEWAEFPKVTCRDAWKPIAQVVSAGPSEPAPSDEPVLIGEESALSDKAMSPAGSSSGALQPFKWADDSEDEETVLLDHDEDEQPVADHGDIEAGEEVPLPTQDEQEQSPGNTGNVEDGEKAKKSRKRGKKGGRRVNKNKVTDGALNEPVEASAASIDDEESDVVPAAALLSYDGAADQPQDDPVAVSLEESNMVEDIPETTAPAEDQTNSTGSSDIDASRPASDADTSEPASETNYHSGPMPKSSDSSSASDVPMLSKQKVATKGPDMNYCAVPIPTPPPTAESSSASFSTVPTATKRKSKNQRRKEKIIRQMEAFDEDTTGQDMRSIEAISSVDEAVPVVKDSTVTVEFVDDEEIPMPGSHSPSNADVEDSINGTESTVSSPPARKSKDKKRGKRGGKKVQKKAAKASWYAQLRTFEWVDRAKALFLEYGSLIAGLGMAVFAFCMFLFGAWMKTFVVEY